MSAQCLGIDAARARPLRFSRGVTCIDTSASSLSWESGAFRPHLRRPNETPPPLPGRVITSLRRGGSRVTCAGTSDFLQRKSLSRESSATVRTAIGPPRASIPIRRCTVHAQPQRLCTSLLLCVGIDLRQCRRAPTITRCARVTRLDTTDGQLFASARDFRLAMKISAPNTTAPARIVATVTGVNRMDAIARFTGTIYERV